MNAMKKLIAGLSALSLIPSAVNAHPGHGHEDPWSPLHYLANAQHSFFLWIAVGILALVAGWKLWRKYVTARK
jgi:hypothetical protein